jgi:hypothetical protein
VLIMVGGQRKPPHGNRLGGGSDDLQLFVELAKVALGVAAAVLAPGDRTAWHVSRP